MKICTIKKCYDLLNSTKLKNAAKEIIFSKVCLGLYYVYKTFDNRIKKGKFSKMFLHKLLIPNVTITVK